MKWEGVLIYILNSHFTIIIEYLTGSGLIKRFCVNKKKENQMQLKRTKKVVGNINCVSERERESLSDEIWIKSAGRNGILAVEYWMNAFNAQYFEFIK